jgi:RNA polymerase sigma-70 factor (ECF subfamily)
MRGEIKMLRIVSVITSFEEGPMSSEVPQDEYQRLLSAARTGSRDALGQLLELFRPYLVVVTKGNLDGALRAKVRSSDVVQDSLVNACAHFEQFRGNSPAELQAWLGKILTNRLAYLRRHFLGTDKRQLAREVALERDGDSDLGQRRLEEPMTHPSDSPSQHAARREEQEAVVKAVARLPEDYQKVLHLRTREQLSFEEIGRLLNRSPDAARMLWGRAVEALQRALKEPP